MDHELIKAFNDAYLSSLKIFQNKQRHLYCKILDAVKRTCRATGKHTKQIKQDDKFIDYWLDEILPLTFDTETSIQTSAIDALEQGIFMMDIIKIHQNPSWSKHKAVIMTYPPILNKMRDNRNHAWYRIWCILIRILNRDILRGVTNINSFLLVVEQGFHSTDNTIRIDAFACWRLLIQVFADYNELCTPKVMKLICTPLKLSQPKSVEVAEMKLKVWWFLIIKIADNLSKYYEIVVETFLSYCFGGQRYESVGKLGIICFTALLSTESNEDLETLLNENELEQLNHPSQITKPEIMQKYWHNISNYAITVIKLMIDETEASKTENRMLQLFLRLLLKSMFHSESSSYYEYICDEFIQMLPKHTYPIKVMLIMISSDGINFDNTTENLENYSGIILALMKLLFKVRQLVPPPIFNSCIECIFNFDAFQVNVDRINAIATVIVILQESNDDDSYECFEIKLAIWAHLTKVILKNFDVFEHNVQELIKWITWPIEMSILFVGLNTINCFTKQFSSVWKELLEKFPNEHQQSLSTIKNLLKMILKKGIDQKTSLTLVDAYVGKILKLEFDANHYEDLFDLIRVGMTELHKDKDAKEWLKTLRYILSSINNNESIKLFEKIEFTLKYIWRLEICRQIDNNFLDIWKKEILEIFRKNTTKKHLTQIDELFKSNEQYVWNLLAEQITELQKENTSDIALIEVIHKPLTQDTTTTTLKPCTPKKIVITKFITIEDVNKYEQHVQSSNQTSTNLKRKQRDIIDDSAIETSSSIENSPNVVRKGLSQKRQALLMHSSALEWLVMQDEYKKNKRKAKKIHHDSYLPEFHNFYNQLKENETKFFEYAKMSIKAFNYIIENIRSTCTKKKSNFKQPIPVEERLMITLIYLSTGIPIRELSYSYKMSSTSIRRIVPEVCDAIWKSLQKTHMSEPTIQHFENVGKEFYRKWQFPNCLGSIDSKHIRIKCPPKSGRMYYNYKGFYSIVLLAVVDANYRFSMVDVGAYGKDSDGGVFSNSTIYRNIESGALALPKATNLPRCDSIAEYVFIADEAFPLKRYLMRPYPARGLQQDSLNCNYNYRLSKAKSTVDGAFGVISQKFKILQREMDTNFELTVQIVKVICLLHNIITDIDEIDHLNNYSPDVIDNNKKIGRMNNNYPKEAEEVRRTFVNYFAKNISSSPQY